MATFPGAECGLCLVDLLCRHHKRNIYSSNSRCAAIPASKVHLRESILVVHFLRHNNMVGDARQRVWMAKPAGQCSRLRNHRRTVMAICARLHNGIFPAVVLAQR